MRKVNTIMNVKALEREVRRDRQRMRRTKKPDTYTRQAKEMALRVRAIEALLNKILS